MNGRTEKLFKKSVLSESSTFAQMQIYVILLLMKTLALIENDLAIVNHNLVILDNVNTLRQRIQNKLKLFLGEFSLQPNSGIDWFYLKESKNIEEITKAVRREILQDGEVISINKLDVIFIDTLEKAKQYNQPRRSVVINWSVNSIYGSVSS